MDNPIRTGFPFNYIIRCIALKRQLHLLLLFLIVSQIKSCDIVNNIQMTPREAGDILQRYGVLRSHKDSRVYKRLHRSLSPLLQKLKGRKSKKDTRFYIVTENYPIQGLSDVLRRQMKKEVEDVYMVDQKYANFKEVLSLLKRDSYFYQSHIVQALRSFEKKEN